MQENAWADERVMLEWHTLFKTDTVSLGQEELLLGLDNHGAQSTIKFRSCLREAHTQPAYTPPGPDAPYVCNFLCFPANSSLCFPDCTDLVSPCDHHVGAELKRLMSEFYRHSIQSKATRAAWCDLDKGLTASERRILMAQWAAFAWTQLRLRADFLRTAFVSTGFLVKADRSEDHLIRIDGFNNYDFK